MLLKIITYSIRYQQVWQSTICQHLTLKQLLRKHRDVHPMNQDDTQARWHQLAWIRSQDTDSHDLFGNLGLRKTYKYSVGTCHAHHGGRQFTLEHAISIKILNAVRVWDFLEMLLNISTFSSAPKTLNLTNFLILATSKSLSLTTYLPIFPSVQIDSFFIT